MKYIFLDIDGTIRDFDGFIPESAVEAVRKTRENGHKVLICSARPYAQIDRRVLDIGFDGVIASSGCYILLDGNCIFHKCFETAVSSAIGKYLFERGAVLEFGNYKETAVHFVHEERYRAIDRLVKERLGDKAMRLLSEHRNVSSFEEIAEVEKILCFTHDISLDTVKEQFKNEVSGVTFSIPALDLTGFELHPAGAGKAFGLSKVIEKTGAAIEDTVAAGDSANDEDMLKMAGLGIAMGNGSEEAKLSADLITDTLRNDGLYKAFKKANIV